MSLISEKKDFKIISNLIPQGASVIDIGCNDGSLLQYLKEKNNIDGRGMEIDQNKVAAPRDRRHRQDLRC